MNKVSLPTWLSSNELADLPTWFADWRKRQHAAVLQYGLPTRRHEQWKYTDLSLLTNRSFMMAERQEINLKNAVNQHRLRVGDAVLLVCVNGYFMPALSDLTKLPNEVTACRLHNALRQHAEIETYLPLIDAKQYPFASINAASSLDGLFFYLPDQCTFTTPIHLLSIVLDTKDIMMHPQHMIILGEQTQSVFVEEYFSLSEQTYFNNVQTTIVAKKNAMSHYYKLQQEGREAIHLAHTVVHQEQDSSTAFTHISSGARFARDDVIVHLQASGAACRTRGFYYAQDDQQYIDYHIDIRHNAPRSDSEMLYKGILNGKSRAVFNGKLQVAKGAQKITAYQANHNLLLSNNAEVYSKPELEIYADDVKCKHGATTGQLDQDALFYLCARGIPRDEAMSMLLQGFADEIIQSIAHPGIKSRAQEMVKL